MADAVIFGFGCVVTLVSASVTLLLLYAAASDPPN